LGDSRGFLNLGHIYETFKKDEHEAMKNYEKATERGNEIAKNILALKGKTFIPSMKKNNLQSNMSKILNNNNSQMILEDNTQNSLFLNQSKLNIKVKNSPLPLISSYISSGIPKQLIHKQMIFDSQINNIDGSDKSKGKFSTDENKKQIPLGNSGKKPDKKTSMKENIPSNRIYDKFK